MEFLVSFGVGKDGKGKKKKWMTSLRGRRSLKFS